MGMGEGLISVSSDHPAERILSILANDVPPSQQLIVTFLAQ